LATARHQRHRPTAGFARHDGCQAGLARRPRRAPGFPFAGQFETWLRDTQLVDVDDQRFRIAVPNGFAKDWLETRYRSLISQTLARIVGYSVQVEFAVQGPTASRS